MNEPLTPFERDVVAKCCSGDDPQSRALQQQLLSCVVIERSTSPAGFFAQLAVDDSAALPSGPPRLVISDVVGEHPDLQRGAGFALFVQGGRLAMLEGFTFDEAWPATNAGWTFRYEPERIPTQERS